MLSISILGTLTLTSTFLIKFITCQKAISFFEDVRTYTISNTNVYMRSNTHISNQTKPFVLVSHVCHLKVQILLLTQNDMCM